MRDLAGILNVLIANSLNQIVVHPHRFPGRETLRELVSCHLILQHGSHLGRPNCVCVLLVALHYYPSEDLQTDASGTCRGISSSHRAQLHSLCGGACTVFLLTVDLACA